MKEKWKDIKGLEKKYQISTYGRVKSKERYKKNNGEYVPEIIMKQGLTIGKKSHGYKTICLYINKNKKRKQFIHRLVAKHFIPNIENKKEVNHIDGNKQNNNINNLEWVTPSENMKHAYKIDINKNKMGGHKRLKKINQYNKNNIFIKTYISIEEAKRQTNINSSSIGACANGKRKSAGGFIWKFQKN